MENIFKKDFSYLFYILIFILLFVFKLYLNQILKIPFHFDEAQYWSWSQEIDWGYFSKPPFLAWSIKVISSICGNKESCIRSLSPLFHASTSLVIFYTIYKITNNTNKSMFGSAIYLLMPGVTFSSLFITTDVPLIFFSALLGAVVIKLYSDNGKMRTYNFFLLALLFALATFSKYAAIYFIPSIIVASLFSKRLKKVLYRKELLYAFLLFIFLIMPNIIWNVNNGFATFNHTFDNANIKSFSLNLFEPIKFFIMQFFIFGIVSFFFLVILISRYKTLDDYQKILFTLFFFPIFIIIFLAIFSRANANWAVVGYPFGCVLLATLTKKNLSRVSKNLIISTQIIVSLGLILFIFYSADTKYNPFIKIMHAKDLSLEIKKLIDKKKNVGFIADDREDYAHFLYHNRDLKLKKAKWNGDEKINDHYELTTNVDDLVNMDIIFLTRTKPTLEMIKRVESYSKIKSIKYKRKNNFRIYNIYLFKNWK